MPLWGLIHENRYADNTGLAFGCLFSKSHLSNDQQVDGLLLFVSPLHAEIYRLRLEALGHTGWQLFCTEDSDIANIIRGLRDERLQLWVVVGFSASETQQLLLDENHLLMTSSVGLDILLRRDEEGQGAALRLPSDVVDILQALIARGGRSLNPVGGNKPKEWPTSDDEEWDQYAVEALDRIATLEYIDYQKVSGIARPNLALALFDQGMREWRFIDSATGQRH